MKFFLHTQIGIENITELELKDKFKGKYSLDYTGYIPHKNGMVQIDWRDDAPFAYDQLGSIEDAFYVIDYISDVNEKLSLKDVYKLLNAQRIKENLDVFFNTLNPFDKTRDFRFIARKKAAHDFRRVDLEESVKDFFKKNIKRLQVSEAEGVKEIWVTLVKNRLVIAVRLTTREKRHGYYKTSMVQGSLRPTVGFALGYLAELQNKDTVWDPFCGAGTIGCEISDHFKFNRLLNSDSSIEALSSAKENFSQLKTWKKNKGKISFRNESFFDSKSYASVLISNLPFGNQYEIPEDFAQTFFDKLGTIKELQKIVLLYPHVLEHPDWQLVRKFPVEILGFHAFILRYRRKIQAES